MATTAKRKMLLLHDYLLPTSEIWVDPDVISVAQRLPALPAGEHGRTKESPARTLVIAGKDPNCQVTFLVSELPGVIAAHANWAMPRCLSSYVATNDDEPDTD